MKAWFTVKCSYGDCTAEDTIGGDKGRAGWELVGWATKKWYCHKHGMIVMETKRAALAYNTLPLGAPAPTSALDELLAIL